MPFVFTVASCSDLLCFHHPLTCSDFTDNSLLGEGARGNTSAQPAVPVQLKLLCIVRGGPTCSSERPSTEEIQLRKAGAATCDNND